MTATPYARGLTLREADTALVRWCGRCGGPATALGAHRPDGRFDPASVEVSEEEVFDAIHAQYQTPRYPADPARVRENIARGLHLGTYTP